MAKFKKKKVHKQRASTFHGWGRGAAHHKGAGNRGGRGRAGSGKKSDGKKPSFWKEPQGRHGFSSKSRMKINPVNLEMVQSKLHDLEKMGIAVKSGKGYSVDLTKSVYNKLLGTGAVTVAMDVTVDYASKNVGEKLKAAGGNLKVLKTIVKKVKKKKDHKKKADDAASTDAE